jgi:anti-sigma B factor antagonist
MARSTGLHEIFRIDDPRARVIQARGELDAESGAELRKALTAAMAEGRVNIVLDLTEVVFMDSTALSVVLSALRGAWGRGQALLVAGPLQPPIATLLSITGVDRFVTVHAGRDAALEALNGA